MDFVGFRKSEEEEIGNLSLIYGTQSLLYDHRFRKNSLTESEVSQSMGMLLSLSYQDTKIEDYKQSVLVLHDPYQDMNTICKYYFVIKPKFIATSINTLCEYHRESFRYWLACVTNRLRFGQNLRYKSQNSIRLAVNKGSFKKQSFSKPLLDNFINVPLEVISVTNFENNLGFPVIADKDKSEELIQNWLYLMTFTKIMNRELHPLLCELRSTLGKSAAGTDFEKKSDMLYNLQRLYNRCIDLTSKGKMYLGNFLNDENQKVLKEKSNLPRLKIHKEKDKLLFKFLLVSSVDISRVFVTYLADVQTYDEEKCYLLLSEKIQARVTEFNDLIKNLQRKRFMYSRFEPEYSTQSVLKNVENIVKTYSRRKFGVAATFGEQYELRQRVLHRIQRFYRKLLERISSSLIDTLHTYYRPSVKKEYSKRITNNLLLHVTWTAMNVNLESSNFSSGDSSAPIEHSAKPLEISNVESIITREVMQECVQKLTDSLKYCEQNIFILKPEIIQELILPISYIYEDFFQYLKTFFKRTGAGPHRLLGLDRLTNGKLKEIMTEFMVGLHCNMPQMEEILEHTKEYLRFYAADS